MSDDAPVIGFMCLTDYWHELGEAPGGEKVYASIEELRELRPCVSTCGIAEVEVRLRRIVRGPDFATLTDAELVS
jgi:hypothetical protein